MTAIKDYPPMYSEAARYCDEHDIPREDFERVRVMLAVTEFRRRVEPYQREVSRLMALAPVIWIKSGDGFVRADMPIWMDKAIAEIQSMIDREADALGLTVPAR